MPPGLPRSRWTLIALALLALVCTLGVVEVMARMLVVPFELPPPPAWRTLDPYAENPFIVRARPYLQVFVPGSRYRAERASYAVEYEINAHGFRGPEVPEKRLPRLLVIGDSIAEGHGVPFAGALPTLLADALRADGWEVVSAAMQGGSPLYYAANLPRYLALSPDAVLLLLYENDLWDDRGRESTYFDLPLLDDASVLRLGLVARRAWRTFFPTPLEQLIAHNLSVGPARIVDPRFQWLVAEDEVDREFRRSAVYLDAFADELATRGVPLLVAFVAIGALVPEGGAAFSGFARAFDRNVEAWATARGRPFRSLLPDVADAFAQPSGEGVMIAGDGHPTRDMHRRFAATLTPWIRARLAVEGQPALTSP